MAAEMTRGEASLPSGELLDLDVLERSDRKLLLELHAIHGPIFKAMSDERVTVCVVGLALGRRLLKEHAASLQPMTLDLRTLFAEGFMRQMEGETHRAYRDALIHGINGVESSDFQRDLESIAAASLDDYAAGAGSREGSAQAYLAALTRITGGMLVRLFFGAVPGSISFDRLMDGYHALGPHGIVWKISDKQAKAYAVLRDELRRQAAEETSSPSPAFVSSLFGQLCRYGVVDDTMLGNLIYMVEMGRYDLRGLFRWISKYASENAAWLDSIVDAESARPTKSFALAKALVLETLRMDQSERLMRNVKQDLVFDGFIIPKGAIVRVCLWEAHKDEAVFSDPFTFDPSRFLASDRPDGFSPFGLDHHHCPFSNLSIDLAVAFLRTLARRYHVSAVGNGPAVRGVFHWEPPRRFAITVGPRT